MNPPYLSDAAKTPLEVPINADPREQENLVGLRPEVESMLWRELSRVVRSEGEAPDAPAIPGEVRQRLEQLGYE